MSTKKSSDKTISEAGLSGDVLSTDFIQAKIAGKIQVQIHRIKRDIPWSEEVFALNWFNARSLHLYNLYNAVASRSVRLVGGGYPYSKAGSSRR